MVAMKKEAIVSLLLPVLILSAAPVQAVPTAHAARDLLAGSRLIYTPVEGRSDTWSVTYTGLENLEELTVYIWARKTEYITLFTTVFQIEGEPARAFLRRLLELNDSLLAMKFALREERGKDGTCLIDCQIDLPLAGLTAEGLRTAIEDLVTAVDENYPELDELL